METALAREDSLGYDPYLAGDTTRDSDSDYVPSTPRADSEARRQRVARSPRQMRGVARTQNELEDGRDGMVTEVRRAAEAQNEGERGGVILPYSPLRWHHWYL